MFYVRLAGGHLYGKQLFTWLSLVVSFIASLCPRDDSQGALRFAPVYPSVRLSVRSLCFAV